MKSTQALLFPLSLILHCTPTLAFWRESCSVSQTSRIDPILATGQISGHVHKFAGGSNVDETSTHQSLLASTCSTCEVQSDKSAYWTPQLYYHHPNGTIQSVDNDGMTVYYVGRGGTVANTQPFPVGFQMISGDSTLRSYNTSYLTYQNVRPIADRVSFRCINEANNIPETHYIGQTNCVNGLRAQINFQSCWDGVNLYLPGSAHVAYLSGIDYGVCPPSHPIPIPGLFYEVLYWSNRIDQADGGKFVFANGDTTGFGFHGDFINGWDMDVQTKAVQQCLYTDATGLASECAPLAPSDNDNFSRICLQSPPIIQEEALGFLPALPGCNPLTSGPASASQQVCPAGYSTPLLNGSSPLQPSMTSIGTTSTSVSSTTSTSLTTSQSSTPLIIYPTGGSNSSSTLSTTLSLTTISTSTSTRTTSVTTTSTTSVETTSSTTSTRISTASSSSTILFSTFRGGSFSFTRTASNGGIFASNANGAITDSSTTTSTSTTTTGVPDSQQVTITEYLPTTVYGGGSPILFATSTDTPFSGFTNPYNSLTLTVESGTIISILQGSDYSSFFSGVLPSQATVSTEETGVTTFTTTSSTGTIFTATTTSQATDSATVVTSQLVYTFTYTTSNTTLYFTYTPKPTTFFTQTTFVTSGQVTSDYTNSYATTTSTTTDAATTETGTTTTATTPTTTMMTTTTTATATFRLRGRDSIIRKDGEY